MDRNKIAHGLRMILAIAGTVMFTSCVAPTPPPTVAIPVTPLPLSIHGSKLSLRADTRQLTSRSVNLVVRLVATSSFTNISISVNSANLHLQIDPPRCFFRVLSPPTVRHARRPPYPLPAVPLCSVVLRAVDAGRYPLTIHVRNTSGVDLVAPIHTIVLIQGGSS